MVFVDIDKLCKRALLVDPSHCPVMIGETVYVRIARIKILISKPNYTGLHSVRINGIISDR